MATQRTRWTYDVTSCRLGDELRLSQEESFGWMNFGVAFSEYASVFTHI